MKSFLIKTMAACIAVAFLFTSCTTVPRVRTLPEYLRAVYVPMFKNHSYEPGVEELVTSYTVDEFLADGRLDVVQKNKADIAIEGSIRSFNIQATSFEDDEFPSVSTADATADIVVWETMGNSKRKIGELKKVTASVSFISDPRRVIEEVDVDVKDRLMRELARRIVLEVITGAYQE